ncbi:MAG: hypothetical protein JWO93_1387 [Micrococcaceae bacterium]|nr:hypothetical protein [Micrococcaceae bacterium]
MIGDMHAAVHRSPLVRSFRRSLVAVLGGGVLLAVLLAALTPLDGSAGPVLLLLPAVFLVYVGTGLIAWRRRPSNAMGTLIVGAGAAMYLGNLWNTEIPLLESIGAVCSTLLLGVVVHLLHAFPSGRLHGRISVITVAAGYFAAVILQAPQYLFGPRGSTPMLIVADLPQAAAVGLSVQRVVGAAVMLVTAVLLARRWFDADPRQRRALGPVYSYGTLVVVFFPFSAALLEGTFGLPPAARGFLQFAALGGIPVAFALGMLLGGFAKSGEIEELGTWFGVSGAGRQDVSPALAATLGDPSLRVSYWAAEREAYVDAGGRTVRDGPDAPQPPGRESVGIDIDGARVGAITYDSSLVGDPELVQTAGRVVAIAVDRERLTAELRASHLALQRSRERLVNAIDLERRRIAQDLHDGIQMRLVLLALEAQQLGSIPGTGAETTSRATALRRDIDAAAADLRQLVHNVMPAGLVEHGLWAAVEDLTDRMPIPTRLTMSPKSGAGTLPSAVESTAYFVVAEALTNTVKHAGAGSAAVELALDGDVLRVEVSDDGVGTAAPNSGAGLRGLADRVDVLDGRVRLRSEPGQGTHLTVELPCA